MYIQHLPTELTLAVLEALYDIGSRKEFIDALRVCKAWNELGTPLLWTFVVIDNEIPTFCNPPARADVTPRSQPVDCLVSHNG